MKKEKTAGCRKRVNPEMEVEGEFYSPFLI